MSLLRKALNRATRKPSIGVNPTLGQPDAERLIADLQQGDLEAAIRHYGSLPPARREFCAIVASRENLLPRGRPMVPRWADDLVQRYPDESLGWILRGGLHITVGWAVRGSGRAHTVADDAWEVLHRALESAQSDLERASEIDPTDPAPWCHRSTVARGLSMGTEEVCRCFDEAIACSTDVYAIYRQTLQGLCAKWGGSPDLMWDFVRTSATEFPPGAPQHAIVVDAHLEQWLEEDSDANEHFRGAPAQEILDAARQSVLHPAFEDTPSHPFAAQARNVFAFGLSVIGRQIEAAEQAKLIGDRLDEWPWCYWGEPPEVFARVRRDGRC